MIKIWFVWPNFFSKSENCLPHIFEKVRETLEKWKFDNIKHKWTKGKYGT